MVKLISRRDMMGDYGMVREGDIFEVKDEDVDHYEGGGLAYRYYEPRRSTYETKVLVPEDPQKRRRDKA